MFAAYRSVTPRNPLSFSASAFGRMFTHLMEQDVHPLDGVGDPAGGAPAVGGAVARIDRVVPGASRRLQVRGDDAADARGARELVAGDERRMVGDHPRRAVRFRSWGSQRAQRVAAHRADDDQRPVSDPAAAVDDDLTAGHAVEGGRAPQHLPGREVVALVGHADRRGDHAPPRGAGGQAERVVLAGRADLRQGRAVGTAVAIDVDAGGCGRGGRQVRLGRRYMGRGARGGDQCGCRHERSGASASSE